jgi:hypothetical protein
MKVTHHNDQHLICLSSEEVALLIDLCHAGAFSDELVQGEETRHRLERFLGEMQSSLYATAQSVWRHRGSNRRPSGVAGVEPLRHVGVVEPGQGG